MYFAPYIDATGLHIPTYSDILANLVLEAQSIFGQDIYLGTDSQDYQLISIVSDKINDALQLLQLVYNSRGPATSTGSALDGIVKTNGLARIAATYSTCVLTLSGTAGTEILNGVAQDIGGYLWDLPASVVIGTGGTVDVSAICQVIGSVQANAGEIRLIYTPTYGLDSITNNAVALKGIDIEADSQLRARQAMSTARPSRTVLEGTKGAIAEVGGVTRFIVYENPTNAADSNGLPAHSVTAVVEGGDSAAIAQAIFLKKGPGCLPNGTTIVNVVDVFGQSLAIGYYRPSYVDIDVTVNVKQLAGYTTAITDSIKAALVSYLNGLGIGNSLSISLLWAASLSVMSGKPVYSVTSITFARHLGTLGVADIVMLFYEVARGNLANINVILS